MKNELVPRSLQPESLPKEKKALHLKLLGNAAFKRRAWATAVEHWTAALEKSEDDVELTSTLDLNRAQAHLNLSHHEWAYEDSQAAAVHPPRNIGFDTVRSLNLQALFRAGRAAYELGDFAQAEAFFNQAVSLDWSGESSPAALELRRTQSRLLEQINAEYDFSAMTNSFFKAGGLLDHACFIKKTKIASAGHRGRGLVATNDFRPGDIVIIDKASSIAVQDELEEKNSRGIGPSFAAENDTEPNMINIVNGDSIKLFLRLLDKLLHNPKEANKFLKLWNRGKFKTKQVQVVDGRVPLNIFQARFIA